MELDFETVVKVEKYTKNKVIYGKTKIKWALYIEAATNRVKWISLRVNDQELSLDLIEEYFDESQDRDEEREYSESYKLENCEIEGKKFSLTQDICPTELIISEKGTATLVFPESED